MLLKNIAPEELSIDGRELSARLGDPHMTPTELDRLYKELLAVARPRYVVESVDLSALDGAVSVGGCVFYSNALEKFVTGSDSCTLLVATLGMGVDRLVMKRAHTSASDSFIIDALADAMIEALCDRAEKDVFDDVGARRFSPGYADLELSAGRDILKLTDAERKLGIKLTESGLMIPKKSVNAIMISDKERGV